MATVNESIGFMFNDVVWAIDVPQDVREGIEDFDALVQVFWRCINEALSEAKSDINQDLHCIHIIARASEILRDLTGIELGETRAVYNLCSLQPINANKNNKEEDEE